MIGHPTISEIYAGEGFDWICVDIDQRPAVVETQSRIGDWEADLACGACASGYLVTLASG